MKLIENLESLNRNIDEFLEKISIKEEEDWWVEQRIERLEEIILGENRDFWLIENRFKGLESWLKDEGMELNSKQVKKKYIQRLIECVLKMKTYWNIRNGKKKTDLYNMKILLQANSFIRDSLRRGGWEYTPLGMMSLAQWNEPMLKLKDDIRALDSDEADLKSGYQRTLTYQLDLMDYFYKPKDHLLTILDYQLKSLEIRPTKEDEFFVAALLYYLKQKMYRVESYLDRFKKTIKNQKRT